MTVLQAFNELGLPHSPQVLSLIGQLVPRWYSPDKQTYQISQFENGEWIMVNNYYNEKKLKHTILYIILHCKIKRGGPEFAFLKRLNIKPTANLHSFSL